MTLNSCKGDYALLFYIILLHTLICAAPQLAECLEEAIRNLSAISHMMQITGMQ